MEGLTRTDHSQASTLSSAPHAGTHPPPLWTDLECVFAVHFLQPLLHMLVLQDNRRQRQLNTIHQSANDTISYYTNTYVVLCMSVHR